MKEAALTVQASRSSLQMLIPEIKSAATFIMSPAQDSVKRCKRCKQQQTLQKQAVIRLVHKLQNAVGSQGGQGLRGSVLLEHRPK